MHISSDKLFLIGCGIALVLAVLLTNFFTFIFDISYTTTFFTTCISLIIMFGIGLMLISKKVWYEELTDYSYYQFNKLYQLYITEVIQNKKAYNRFVEDYFAENQWISYSIDSQGNPNLSEIKSKNKSFSQIIGLLQNRRDLVEKYFHGESFRYADYLRLLKEYNTTVTTSFKEEEKLENSPLSEEEKQIRLEKAKAEILAYYSYKDNKQLGDRIFGYLIISELIPAYTPDERKKAWETFIGEDIKPSDIRLHKTPKQNRSKDNLKLVEHLEMISDFFSEIELHKAKEKVQSDLEKLSKD